MAGMYRFVSRRLALITVGLVLANFLGFAYAHLGRIAQAARNPYLTQVASGSLFEAYRAYLLGALQLDFGLLPNQLGVVDALAAAGVASLGLLVLALLLSIVVGLALGLAATRTNPPGVAGWLHGISTVGLAMPGFYLGSLLILGSVFYAMAGPGAASPIPIQGYGWDLHLIYPLLALMLRPTVQIARVTSSLLSEQLREQYVLVARSFGYPWRAVRWKVALRNIYAAVILSIAGSFRLLMGELIVVEWLFNWPGVGRLFAITLIPNLSSSAFASVAPGYLNPPLVAAILTLSTGVFMASDLVASSLARWSDPRLRATDGETSHP